MAVDASEQGTVACGGNCWSEYLNSVSNVTCHQSHLKLSHTTKLTRVQGLDDEVSTCFGDSDIHMHVCLR